MKKSTLEFGLKISEAGSIFVMVCGCCFVTFVCMEFVSTNMFVLLNAILVVLSSKPDSRSQSHWCYSST